MSLRLLYQQKIFQQFIDLRDQLIISSQGLEIEPILVEYLLSLTQLSKTTNYLVFILSGEENSSSSSYFEQLCIGKVPIVKMDMFKTHKERIEVYKRGGVVKVTSRILIVDMLSDRVPFHLITGMVLWEAHSIKAHSIENFIFKLYRLHNQEGFLKAFSTNSTFFLNKFNRLEHCMKRLFLREVSLWPRFQVQVKSSLEVGTGEVKEFQLQLTKPMKLIRESLLECLHLALLELKRTKLLLEMEDELTLDNACTGSLVSMVRHHLEPIWHRVGNQTKQTVEDLVILRNLSTYLTLYDGVTFLSYLDTIFANGGSYELEKQPSAWMLTDAANTLLTVARARVYRKVGGNNQPTLEVQPKWKLVKQLVDRFQKDHAQGKVLVKTQSRVACQQLQAYLGIPTPTSEKHPMLLALYHRYWDLKHRRHPAPGEPEGGFVPGGGTSRPQDQPSGRGRGRRRVRGGGGYQTTLNQFVNNPPTYPPPSQQNSTEPTGDPNPRSVDRFDDALELDLVPMDFGLDASLRFDPSYLIKPDFCPPNRPKWEILVTTQLNLPLLQGFQPDLVVLYEPDLPTIRQVEVYKGIQYQLDPGREGEPFKPSTEVEVVSLVYVDSQEEQNGLTSIRKEKLAFEKLIQTKATMVLPIDLHLPKPNHLHPDLLSHHFAHSHSRLAGGQVFLTQPKVLVDVREFRLSLPSHLHAMNFQLVPTTLPIGDYILYDRCCVERKTISDLIQSIKSGRLFFQLEQMVRYYPLPILLLEFDLNRGFGLDVVGDSRTRVQLNEMVGKLLQLIRQFPTLKLICSPSPKFTAQLLYDLKLGNPDPDLEFHLNRKQSVQDSLDGQINPTPTDLLRNLPGITNLNYPKVLAKVKDMSQLVDLPLGQLQELLGKEDGLKLFQFINMKLN